MTNELAWIRYSLGTPGGDFTDDVQIMDREMNP